MTAVSTFSSKTHTMRIPLGRRELGKGLRRWRLGAFIQDALPTLTPGQREFLKTGITPEEWGRALGDQEIVTRGRRFS